MNKSTKSSERIREVRRIFEEHGIGNLEILEGWNGEELEELAPGLTEEEFQTLLDELEDPGEDRTP